MKIFHHIMILSILLFASIQGQEGIQFLSNLDPRSNYNDIWGYAADGREYALVGSQNGTSIVDITDPANPAELTFIEGPASGWRDIKTHSTYAYIVTEGRSTGKGLQIVDLSNLPNSASLVKTVDEFFEKAHNIFISEGFAYVIGTEDGGGMHILDLADPVNPIHTAYYTESDYIHDIYAWEDTVIACSEDTYDLVDVSDKSNPVLVSSSAALPGIYAHSGWMTEDKRYFIAAEEFNQRDITIWDLKDRNNWNLVVPELKLSNSTPVHNIFVKGDYAHVSYYKEGYVVFDISDPTEPIIADQYDTYASESGFFDGAWGCYPFLPSGNIIISDMSTGLYVFSFSPIDNPAPYLQHSSPGDEVNGDEQVKLDLKAFDNGELDQVLLYYRTIFNGNTGNWISQTDSNGPNNNNYEFIIPIQEHLAIVEYYFAAQDNEGKITTLPEGGSGTPPGSIPPSQFYSYITIDAGIPIITSISPSFSDTTITKGESILFSVSAEDTSSLDLTFAWNVNGQRKGSETTYTYGTTFVFSERTDTLELVVSNGYNQVSKTWIITVDFTSDIEDKLVLSYELNQNYPNPFNPSTKISYSIPEGTDVQLKIFNSLGELVESLVDGYQSKGKYEVEFNASNLSSGFYIAKITTSSFSKIIKMILLK